MPRKGPQKGLGKKKKSQILLQDQIEPEPKAVTPPEPKFLNETDAIYFWSAVREDDGEPRVPPCTPQNISSFVTFTQPLPPVFPPFDKFVIPYVREVGVKKCMELLGKYLKCTDYAFDYLQFWLIDILTDCLWKAQDEYYLSEAEQKIVLEWIVYVFQVMTDPKLCYSRKQFFKFFKEIVMMAADMLNEGNEKIPKPEEIVVMKGKEKEEDEDESELSESDDSRSNSTISFSTCKSDEIIEMEIGDQKRTYTIKNKKCLCHLDEDCKDKFDLPTSLTNSLSVSKHSTQDISPSQTDPTEGGTKSTLPKPEISSDTGDAPPVETETFDNKGYKMFHQPDPNIPKRFLPLTNTSTDLKGSTADSLLYTVFSDGGGEYQGLEMDLDLYHISSDAGKTRDEGDRTEEEVEEMIRKIGPSSRSSKVRTNDRQSMDILPNAVHKAGSKKSFTNKRNREASFSKVTINPPQSAVDLSYDGVIKRLQQYKLEEKHLQDMADPRIGWYTPPEAEEAPPKEEAIDPDNEDWEELEHDLQRRDDRLYVGFGVLCAIVDCVFEYFYRNFHYTLITLATKTYPSVITQKLNAEWKVPKTIKEEFSRPKPDKKKKEKKEKKSKKGKSDKSSKKSKKSGKKDKSSKKGSKKGSDKKSKKSKDSKKSKKEKPKKLTKEEKAELERQRKLQEEYEAERRRLEENRKLLFPLTDAATDDFFMDIFEGWQKPKTQEKKGKKEKKEKKGKKK